ncbi:MAG: chromate efflux transporter [Syntrophobacteraceae bacterium]|nr:chromate efflux transporter [Syntrophobacteraceae bacterium]
MNDSLDNQTLDQAKAAPALSLPALLLTFLKIGAIGFGGGMAVIALMEQDLVNKKHAISSEEFLHGVGMAQVLGPFAPNTALFVGNRLYGPLGGLACALAFLIPSVTLVILLSWLYFAFHAIPGLQRAIGGLGPVVIALILSAAWSMGRKAVRSWPTALLGLVSLAVSLFKVNAVYVLVAAGVVGLLIGKQRLAGLESRPDKGAKAVAKGPKSTSVPALALLPAVGGTAAGLSLATLGSTFLKVGCVFFGGGFVLVPILQQKLVSALGWLTPRQFIDGVAISNLTPGPIAVLATFTGFHLHGVSGALISTLCLFTPAFVLMTVLSHEYARLKGGRHFQDFLAGVTPAVVGLVISAAVLLAPGALRDLAGWALMVFSLFLLARLQWHPAWVLAIGAVLGAVGLV